VPPGSVYVYNIYISREKYKSKCIDEDIELYIAAPGKRSPKGKVRGVPWRRRNAASDIGPRLYIYIYVYIYIERVKHKSKCIDEEIFTAPGTKIADKNRARRPAAAAQLSEWRLAAFTCINIHIYRERKRNQSV